MKQDFTIWRNQILQNPWDISPLKFGMSQDEIMEVFGKPDAVFHHEKRRKAFDTQIL